MTRLIRINKQPFLLAIPFLLIGFLVLFSKFLVGYNHQSILSLAITIDLLLTVPLVYYFVIRKTKIPKTTVVPVLLLAVLAGTYGMPAESQHYLDFFKTWALPLIEVSVVSFIIWKVSQSRKKYLKNKEITKDFFSALKETCYEILPAKMVYPFATEIAVIYYGFINWKIYRTKENEFTYHKKAGSIGLLVTFIGLIFIETFALHLLISKWNNTIAWIFTGLSVYTAIQVFGLIRSFAKRPIIIANDRLVFRYGIWAETEILFENITGVKFSKMVQETNNRTKHLSPFVVLEGHNMLIELNKENVLFGLYGIQKKYSELLLHIDDKEAFKKQIDQAMSLWKENR